MRAIADAKFVGDLFHAHRNMNQAVSFIQKIVVTAVDVPFDRFFLGVSDFIMIYLIFLDSRYFSLKNIRMENKIRLTLICRIRSLNEAPAVKKIPIWVTR